MILDKCKDSIYYDYVIAMLVLKEVLNNIDLTRIDYERIDEL